MDEEKLVISLAEFKLIPAGMVFRKGKTTDDEKGCNIDSTGKQLLFVAKKGQVNDWAVYVLRAEQLYGDDYDTVRTNGLKVLFPENIQNVVPCDDEVLKLYRR